MSVLRSSESTAEEAALTTIRDALLQKLTSGEIRGKDAERFGEAKL